jgi:hypothetical protein
MAALFSSSPPSEESKKKKFETMWFARTMPEITVIKISPYIILSV